MHDRHFLERFLQLFPRTSDHFFSSFLCPILSFFFFFFSPSPFIEDFKVMHDSSSTASLWSPFFSRTSPSDKNFGCARVSKKRKNNKNANLKKCEKREKNKSEKGKS